MTVATEKEQKTQLIEQGRTLGLEIHPNTKIENMVNMVNQGLIYKLSGSPDAPMTEEVVDGTSAARRAAERLVRVRVNALDPQKQGVGSEPFGFSNSVIGTIQRVVPIDTDEGFYIPVVLIDIIKEKKYRITKYRQDDRGNDVPYSVELPAFSVEILDDLTAAEVDVIRQRQLKNK